VESLEGRQSDDPSMVSGISEQFKLKMQILRRSIAILPEGKIIPTNEKGGKKRSEFDKYFQKEIEALYDKITIDTKTKDVASIVKDVIEDTFSRLTIIFVL
jgi:hypothetical protein